MTDIQTTDWTETASGNNASPPNGWPEGQSAASVNDCAREDRGAIKREYNRSHPVKTSTGTATALVLTYDVAPSAYAQGMIFAFKAHVAVPVGATLDAGPGPKNVFFNRMQTQPAWMVSGEHVLVSYDAGLDAFLKLDAGPLSQVMDLTGTQSGTVTFTAGAACAGRVRLDGLATTITGDLTVALQVRDSGTWKTSAYARFGLSTDGGVVSPAPGTGGAGHLLGVLGGGGSGAQMNSKTDVSLIGTHIVFNTDGVFAPSGTHVWDARGGYVDISTGVDGIRLVQIGTGRNFTAGRMTVELVPLT